MNRRSAVSAAFLFGVCTSFVGCSGEDADRSPVHEVTGKITYNKSPVAGALVTFSPKGDQRVATARTDANGEYTLTTFDAGDGAMPGEYTVLVSKVAAAAGATEMAHGPNAGKGAHGPGAAAGAGGSGSLIPEKYAQHDQSDLEATVSADGENRFDYDLK